MGGGGGKKVLKSICSTKVSRNQVFFSYNIKLNKPVTNIYDFDAMNNLALFNTDKIPI